MPYVSLSEHLSLFQMRLVGVVPAAKLRSLTDWGFYAVVLCSRAKRKSASVCVYHTDGDSMADGIFI